MRSEAEIRAEIDRLEALAEKEYAEGRKINAIGYETRANDLAWVIFDKGGE